MLVEHVELYEDKVEVEEVEVEEVELTEPPADPRLAGLSPETRRFIDAAFDGDVDLAARAAELHRRLYRNPPRWAVEIAGPPKGWRDPARLRF